MNISGNYKKNQYSRLDQNSNKKPEIVSIKKEESGKILLSEGIKENNNYDLSKISRNAQKILETYDIPKKELGIIIKNLKWINEKIKEKNKSISSNLLKRIVHEFIKTISFGKFGLKYQDVEKSIEKAEKKFKTKSIEDEIIQDLKEIEKIIQKNSVEKISAEQLPALEKKLSDVNEKFENFLKQGYSFPHFDKFLKIDREARQIIIEMKEKIASEELARKKKEEAAKRIEKIKLYIKENLSLIQKGKVGTKKIRGEREIVVIKAKDIMPQEASGYNFHYELGSGTFFVHLGTAGKGSFKVVKKHLNLSTQEITAVAKERKTLSSEEETRLMRKFQDNPHVAGYRRVYTYEKSNFQQYVTIQEYYSMGELKGWLEKLSDAEKLKVACDILKGVQGMHQENVMHRDLKPANIFLKKVAVNDQKEEEIHAVVGDLGFACETTSERRFQTAGSPLYMAPIKLGSAINGNRSRAETFADDAWAIGVIFSELFKGKRPGDLGSARYREDVVKAGYALENAAAPPNKNSIDFIIWKLLRPKEEERMTVDEALTIMEQLRLQGPLL